MSKVPDAAFSWDSIPVKANPTAPAAGANFTYTVPAGKRAQLTTFSGMLTSSVAVANRLVRFYIQRAAGNVIFMTPPSANGYFANQTAGQADTYFFFSGVAFTDGADQVVRFASLPQIELMAGDVINLIAVNIQAADVFLLAWTYKEAPA